MAKKIENLTGVHWDVKSPRPTNLHIFVKTVVTFIVMVPIFSFSSVSQALQWPADYESQRACKKQQLLWDQVNKTNHLTMGEKKLPDFEKLDLQRLGQLFNQYLMTKTQKSDVAPEGWVKHLHQRGAMAKVKFVADPHSNYTGVFASGASCGLMRLSLTAEPKMDIASDEVDRGVAPGMALKLFIDGKPSLNVSALVSLIGQGYDHNFFRHPMSNIVPIEGGTGARIVHGIFSRVTDYAEELLVTEMAAWNEKGEEVPFELIQSPRQLFFVPNPELTSKFSAEPHDVREDMLNEIPIGTEVYTVLAAPSSLDRADYRDYMSSEKALIIEASQSIGKIVTTSRFLASEFGDNGILFRHQIRPKTEK